MVSNSKVHSAQATANISAELSTLGGSCYRLDLESASWGDMRAAVERLSGIPTSQQRLYVGTDEVLHSNFSVMAASLDMTVVSRPSEQVWWLDWLQSPSTFQHHVLEYFPNAPAHIRDDREIALAAVLKDGSAVQSVSDTIRSDREFTLSVLSKISALPRHGFHFRESVSRMLKCLPSCFCEDREIVMAAVRACGEFAADVHHYASDKLLRDRDVILAAITSVGEKQRCSFSFSRGHALEKLFSEMPREHRCDREVALTALGMADKTEEIFAALPKQLQSDREVILTALKWRGIINPYTLQNAAMRALAIYHDLLGPTRADLQVAMAVWRSIQRSSSSDIPRAGAWAVAVNAWKALSQSMLPMRGHTLHGMSSQQVLSLVCGRYHLHQIGLLLAGKAVTQSFLQKQSHAQSLVLGQRCSQLQVGQSCLEDCERLKRGRRQRRSARAPQSHQLSQALLGHSGRQSNRKQQTDTQTLQKMLVTRSRVAQIADEIESSLCEWHDRDWHDYWLNVCDDWELSSQISDYY